MKKITLFFGIVMIIFIYGCNQSEADNLPQTDVVGYIEPQEEIPSILTTILDEEGLKLICDNHEQISVARFNTTCSFRSCFLSPCDESDRWYISYIDKIEKTCGWGDKESVEAIIVNIDGECLEYKIVRR